jgi:transketolase
MRKEFARLMLEMGEKDDKLAILAGDIGVFGLRNFRKKYPKRFYNIGICEQSIISIASGMAIAGFIPVVHSIAPFITERCFEQIKNDFCYQGLGGNIVSVGSAFDYAGLGCTHHTYSDIAIIRCLPDSEIIYPSCPKEFEVLFKQTYNNGKLTYFRLPERKHTLTLAEGQIKFGKGILVKSGSDISVIVAGPQVDNARKASEILKNKNIDVEVIYIHTIKPIDEKLIIDSALKTKRILTIEEGSVFGGMGAEISRVTEHLKDIEQFRQGIDDRFITDYGSYDEICKKLGFDSVSIAAKIEEIVKK